MTKIEPRLEARLISALAGKIAANHPCPPRSWREAVARHEAGHALCGWRLGVGIEQGFVDPAGSGGFVKFGEANRPITEPYEQSRDYLQTLPDQQAVRAMLSVLDLTPDEQAREYARLEARAREIVVSDEWLIRELAAELIRRPRMAGAEIVELLNSAAEWRRNRAARAAALSNFKRSTKGE